MTAIVTQNFRNAIASEFVDSFARDDISYYIFIGKILPWANEAAPDTGNTSINSQRDAWNGMISAKRLGGDAIRLVIPRASWANNLVYTSYDDADPNYFTNTNNQIYVVTSNNEVYKCIDNGNNSPSTIEPAGTNNNNGFIRMGDGYTWKYMFMVASQPSDNLFTTPNLIPVPRSQVGTTTVIPGSLDRIIVLNPGFGYNTSNAGIDLAIVSITGDGTGAQAVATVGALGNVSSVKVISQGTGYTWANIAFSGGSGATARAVLSPKNGHAFAPADELNAKKALLAARIGVADSTEGGTFTIQNDFRQYGVIKNPYKYGTTTIANANSVSQTINITVVADANPNFSVDDFVFQIDTSGNTVFSGYVVDIGNLSNTSILKVTQTRGTVQAGTPLLNATSTKRVQSYTNPPFEKYSGQVLYFENIPRIQRNNNQAETFKILFDF